MKYDTLDTSRLPVLPLKATTLFPGTSLPIRAVRAKSLRAIEIAMKNGEWLVALPETVDTGSRDPELNELSRVGTLSKIEKLSGNAKDGYQLVLRGVSRYRIDDLVSEDDRITTTGSAWKDIDELERGTRRSLLENLKTLAREILEYMPGNTEPMAALIREIDDLAYLTHLIAANLDLTQEKRQQILETPNVRDRTLLLLKEMQDQKDAIEVRHELNHKLAERMGKMQREAILREQMKTIQDELGEGKGPKPTDYRKKIEESGMPKEVKKVALDELNRLDTIGSSSPETHVIRNYLDLLISLPWDHEVAREAELIDIDFARETLHQDHFGLEPVKKRILQHLAVMKLKKSNRGQILLLVGPPGVGKTSLGQSIAKAMGRKFMRVALGGVRDDAEIRGHRRTYVGAMPGKIIQALKRAGQSDAVFMLDEIDKLGRGYSGDPAAALLEVLDPEQNSTFMDHYLDVPYDLSKIFFIATANSLESIPGPLLDRMEIVELSGYVTAEKLHIAKNHLIPKQLKEFGLKEEQVKIEDPVLLRIMSHYTREAGVRDLQRKIASLLRASTEKVLSAKPEELPVIVNEAFVEEVLGQERYVHEVTERVATPGVVTGLAWTPMGGEILFIESTLMPGTGKLILTGQLGDVMKESTQIALSLIRSHLAKSIPSQDFEKKDIHVHVPAGAIPKDGPSAGVTMLTSLASVFLGSSVDSKLAMTGEITLRGAVMPVGGIKEKIIAAHRAGVERVILSKRNEKDLKDVPEEVRGQLKFVLVENVAELLKAVFGIEVSLPWSTPEPAKASAGVRSATSAAESFPQ